MSNRILIYSEKLFELIKTYWESTANAKMISRVLVITFMISFSISLLVKSDILSFGQLNPVFMNSFFAIELSFTLLLLIEILGLIFVLPKSVARSVGKQFELLSLIFLRSGIKEFSHVEDIFHWDVLPEQVLHMFSYGFGALAIFVIMGFTYNSQKHIALTNTEDDQIEFVRSKKLLALFLLMVFVGVGIFDIKNLFDSGHYLQSFNLFYTFLIFSDIVIVLIALRYTDNYYKIFRYSAFILGTIFIRISLSAAHYYNVLIGIAAALFIYLLTLSYNYFLKEKKE